MSFERQPHQSRLDSFLVNGVKTKSPSKTNKKGINPKNMKQLTIESLPRVVKIDDFLQFKSCLEKENQDTDILIKGLRQLQNTQPSKEILLNTKIGHIVNKLRKHSDSSVRGIAGKVLKDWKTFYREKKTRQGIEVRCDAKTELLRMKARKLISEALGLPTSSSPGELIEKVVFQQHAKRVDVLYKRKIRGLCFILKQKENIREQVVEGKIDAEDLCLM